jgi:hypothetical protein
MAVSIFGLLMVVVLGLLLLGGGLAVIALLANPRTRAAGAVLLAVGLLVVVVGGFLVLGLSLTAPAIHRARSMAELQRARAEEARLRGMGFKQDNPQPVPQALPERPSPQAGEAGTVPDPAPAEQPLPPAADGEAPPSPDAKAEAEPETPAAAEQPAQAPSPGTDAAPAGPEQVAKQPEPPATEKRPPWVDQAPGRVGGVYRLAIKTDPRPTREECESELPGVVQGVITQYVESELKRSPEVARRVRLPLTYIQDHIVQQKWPEPVQISLGNWVRLHALLEFDQEANQQIGNQCQQAQQQLEEEWQQASVMRRLGYSGAGLAAVLALLSVLFACLKIDQATDGARRGRLFLAAAAVIVAVAGAACFAVQSLQQYPVAPDAVSPASPAGELAAYSAPQLRSIQAPPVVFTLAVVLVAVIAVTLLASKRGRPVALVLLILVLAGGLTIGLRVADFPGLLGRGRLLVIGVVTFCALLLPLLVVSIVAARARKTPREAPGAETPGGEPAEVPAGQR